MQDRKQQLIEELIAHLEASQGSDLGALVLESKKPKAPLKDLEDEGAETPMDAIPEDDSKPDFNDQANEAIESIGKPEEEAAEGADEPKAEGEEEMSDEELAELLKKYL